MDRERVFAKAALLDLFCRKSDTNCPKTGQLKLAAEYTLVKHLSQSLRQ
jgi:hypothetical protein